MFTHNLHPPQCQQQSIKNRNIDITGFLWFRFRSDEDVSIWAPTKFPRYLSFTHHTNGGQLHNWCIRKYSAWMRWRAISNPPLRRDWALMRSTPGTTPWLPTTNRRRPERSARRPKQWQQPGRRSGQSTVGWRWTYFMPCMQSKLYVKQIKGWIGLHVMWKLVLLCLFQIQKIWDHRDPEQARRHVGMCQLPGFD